MGADRTLNEELVGLRLELLVRAYETLARSSGVTPSLLMAICLNHRQDGIAVEAECARNWSEQFEPHASDNETLYAAVVEAFGQTEADRLTDKGLELAWRFWPETVLRQYAGETDLSASTPPAHAGTWTDGPWLTRLLWIVGGLLLLRWLIRTFRKRNGGAGPMTGFEATGLNHWLEENEIDPSSISYSVYDDRNVLSDGADRIFVGMGTSGKQTIGFCAEMSGQQVLDGRIIDPAVSSWHRKLAAEARYDGSRLISKLTSASLRRAAS